MLYLVGRDGAVDSGVSGVGIWIAPAELQITDGFTSHCVNVREKYVKGEARHDAALSATDRARRASSTD